MKFYYEQKTADDYEKGRGGGLGRVSRGSPYSRHPWQKPGTHYAVCVIFNADWGQLLPPHAPVKCAGRNSNGSAILVPLRLGATPCQSAKARCVCSANFQGLTTNLDMDTVQSKANIQRDNYFNSSINITKQDSFT